MMISVLFLGSILAAKSAVAEVPQTANEQYWVRVVSQASRTELSLVDRLKSLRKAVEKFPENWQVSGLKSLGNGGTVTRAMLLADIESMELAAADRWSILIENTATLDLKPEATTTRVKGLRSDLDQVRVAHLQIHQKLDELSKRISDATLLMMANQFVQKN